MSSVVRKLQAAAVAMALLATPAAFAGTSAHKVEVVDLLKSLETGAIEPAGVINPQHYTQHNLAVADGIAGFEALRRLVPKGSMKVNTVRVLEDGDLVATQTEYDSSAPKIGFDIFRFENGKIVEHWDNLQSATGPNPSQHTMTDGAIAITDPDKTAANKDLVRAFVDDVLVNGRFDTLGTYIDGGHYTQHNPQIGDGLSGLRAALDSLAKAGITMKYAAIHKILGEGNMVLVTSEGSLGGKTTAFYDLFRVENGKLVEHWDVIEAIPPRDEWKNSNGKF